MANRNQTELDSLIDSSLVAILDLSEHNALLKSVNESVVKKKDRSSSITLSSGTYTPDFTDVELINVTAGSYHVLINSAPTGINDGETKYIVFTGGKLFRFNYGTYFGETILFNYATSSKTIVRITRKSSTYMVENLNKKNAPYYAASSGVFDFQTFYETYLKEQGQSEFAFSLDSATSITTFPAGLSKTSTIIFKIYTDNVGGVDIFQLIELLVGTNTIKKYVGYYAEGLPTSAVYWGLESTTVCS